MPGLDPNELFDHVVHVRRGMPDQTEAGYDRPHDGEEDKWSPYDHSFGGFLEGGTHWSEVLTNNTFNFINAAHDPRQSPKEFVESYDSEELQISENFMEGYPYNEAMGSGRNLRDERLAPFPRTEYVVRVHRQ